MSIETWLAFVVASTALLLIPGPTVLLVLSYALARGRSVAVASALGVATGDLIAMSLSLAGLGALVAASAAAFALLKWVGAAYLVYLGVKMLGAAPHDGLPTRRIAGEARGVFWHNASVTALNPKSIAFFIVFVPQFVRTETALAPQFALLIATFVILAALNALAYALAADRLRRRIAKPEVITRLTRAGGVTLILMGLATAAMRRSA